MKSQFKALLIWFLSSPTLLPVVQATTSDISDLITQIPSCALPCLLKGLAQAPDALSDPASSCRNVTLQASLSACIQSSCNYTEQARVGVVNNELCAGIPIDESRTRNVIIISSIFGPLAILIILLRMYSRYAITKRVGGDDWTMLAAGAVMVVVLGLNYENILRNGYARHYWNIDPLRITPLLKIFYAAEISYIVEVTLVKVSILQFYLRVFPAKWFKVADLIILALVVSAGIGILLSVLFQCSPVRRCSLPPLSSRLLTRNLGGAWDLSEPNLKCININLLAYATGGIGVGFDIIILALPVPELLALNMNRKKKLHVLFMFSLGSIACITSIIRLKYLAEFAKSTDPTWDNVYPVLWSLIEICTAIICACLPALRALFSHYCPQLFNNDTTFDASYSNHPGNSGNFGKHNLSSMSGRAVLSKVSPQSRNARGGPDEKPYEGARATTPGGSRSSWFTSGNFIAHNREVVQDVESGHGSDGREDSLTGPHPNTVTTKVWVDRSTQQLKGKVRKPARHGSQFKSKASRSTDDHSPSNGGRRSKVAEGHKPQTARTGSQDSIFIIEGPRDTASDSESDFKSHSFDDSRGRSEKINEIELSTMNASPAQRSVSRGNRYDEDGSLRRNTSLDLRGGEVRIPISAFSTKVNNSR